MRKAENFIAIVVIVTAIMLALSELSTAVFAILKVSHVIHWTWEAVCTPLGVFGVYFALAVASLLFVSLFVPRREDRYDHT